MQPLKTTKTERINDPAESERSFWTIRESLLAMRADELVTPNANLLKAGRTCMGTLVRIEPLRPELEKLYDFQLEDLEILGHIARAAFHVHAMAAGPPKEKVRKLVKEGTRLRTSLVGAGRPLADRGLMRGDQLDRLATGRSHVELVSDLKGLNALYRSVWARIGGKTPVTEAEVVHAEDLGKALIDALVERDTARADPELHPVELRMRVFTLMKQTYVRVQRAVGYLRFFHGDAAELVPPLTPARGGRRKTEQTDDGTAEADKREDDPAPVEPPPAVVPRVEHAPVTAGDGPAPAVPEAGSNGRTVPPPA